MDDCSMDWFIDWWIDWLNDWSGGTTKKIAANDPAIDTSGVNFQKQHQKIEEHILCVYPLQKN